MGALFGFKYLGLYFLGAIIFGQLNKLVPLGDIGETVVYLLWTIVIAATMILEIIKLPLK